ncbi:MAG TPA: hypothetical protein VKG45_06465 [Actinomycetes bacterium]|nr:hypothetical protein [Actinomycetes bacterium]
MTQAASHAPPRPARAPRAEPQHRLRVIRAPRAGSRLPFLALAGLVVVVGVLGLAALTVAVNQQAFAIARLEQQTRDSAGRYTVLQADVDRLRSPARLSQVARERGLGAATPARFQRWPSARDATTPAAARDGTASQAAPTAAPSPAAAGAPTAADAGRVWTPDDPFPLKQYLAQP